MRAYWHQFGPPIQPTIYVLQNFVSLTLSKWLRQLSLRMYGSALGIYQIKWFLQLGSRLYKKVLIWNGLQNQQYAFVIVSIWYSLGLGMKLCELLCEFCEILVCILLAMVKRMSWCGFESHSFWHFSFIWLNPKYVQNRLLLMNLSKIIPFDSKEKNKKFRITIKKLSKSKSKNFPNQSFKGVVSILS